MLKVTIKGVKIVKHYENSKKIDYLSVIFFETKGLSIFFDLFFRYTFYLSKGKLPLLQGLDGYQFAFLIFEF